MEDYEMDVSPSPVKVIPELDEKQKDERKLHAQITKLYPTYIKVQKMLLEYNQKFGFDFAEDENADNDSETKLFCECTDNRPRLKELGEQLPEGVHGCIVCGSRNAFKFSHTMTLCKSCRSCVSTKGDKLLKCNGESN